VRSYFYRNPPPGTRVAQMRAEASGQTVASSVAEPRAASPGTSP
jgi:hypothetical protein